MCGHYGFFAFIFSPGWQIPPRSEFNLLWTQLQIGTQWDKSSLRLFLTCRISHVHWSIWHKIIVEGFFFWYCADFYAGMTGQGNNSIISRRLRVQAVLPSRLRPRLLIVFLCRCFVLSTSFPSLLTHKSISCCNLQRKGHRNSSFTASAITPSLSRWLDPRRVWSRNCSLAELLLIIDQLR